MYRFLLYINTVQTVPSMQSDPENTPTLSRIVHTIGVVVSIPLLEVVDAYTQVPESTQAPKSSTRKLEKKRPPPLKPILKPILRNAIKPEAMPCSMTPTVVSSSFVLKY